MRLLYKFCLCCFILGMNVSIAESQIQPSYYFHNLNINNGLSQNTVNAIIQDESGFMWFGTKDGLNRYDGISFKTYRDHKDSNNGLKHGFITTLYEGQNHSIWVGTDLGVYIYHPNEEYFDHFSIPAQNGRIMDKTINKIGRGINGSTLFAVDGLGLFVYDEQQKKLRNYPFSTLGSVREFQLDRSGRIWITFYKGLYYTDDNFKTVEPYRWKDGTEPFKDESITTLYLGKSGFVFMGSEKNGLIELNLKAQAMRRLPLSLRAYDPIFVRCLQPYSEDELWVGTETGVYIYNLSNKTSRQLQYTPSDPFSLSDNAIYSLYKDREGGMWIGSYFGGVNYYPKQTTYFEKYYPTNDSKTLQGQRVREICKGNGQDLWIGTEDAGLFRFNTQTKEFKHFNASASFSNIHGLCMDGDELWVGTFSKGVRVINTVTGQVKSFTVEDNPGTIADNYVFSICKVSDGDIYLGTSLNLMRYDKKRETFEKIPELEQNLVYDIKEDFYGNIWVATYSNGLYRRDHISKKWEHFQQSEKKGGLPYNKILSIFEDSKRQIWVTTQGKGFCKYDDATKTFVQYQDQTNLNYGVVYQIIEDDQGFFWLTTNNGLIRFQPADGTTKTYTVASGLLSDQFNYKSGYKTAEGNILFGCISGLISFNPNTFSENTYVPPVYITDFFLFGKAVNVADEKSPLEQSILYADSITLRHDQNHFSLRIAALSYQAPKVNAIQYKLEGIGEEWQNVTESSLISYSNLSSGKYLFKLRGSNNDKLWNPVEKVLYIEILPPFYLTSWAYTIYFVLLVGIILFFFQFFRNRQQLKQKWFIQKLEQNKERELHDAKINFFTNITHEIRTPLTLIKGPLEHIIIKNNIEDPDVLEDLHIMKNNADRLLDLTNQLLDFRKSEREGFLLRLSAYDIPTILKEIQQSFSPLIKEYDREFTLNVEQETFSAFIDKEAFVKIISNLFSNAIKYADRYIHVRLQIDKQTDLFEIHVESDGMVIPDEQHEEIFKPFIRLHEWSQTNVPGTGIGMYLARTLAELHNGKLLLLTTANKNIFSLVIPIYHQSNAVEIKDEVHEFSETNIDTSAKSHTILIVEDSLEMQRFIKKVLPEKYKIQVASNGEEALALLKTSFVTLVISDVMMPGMSGVELCRLIKSDVNYSHTPVVLLTAKTALQSKIEGIDVGADAYVEKPFSPDYLLAIIANLINNREKLREAFMKNPLTVSNTMVNNEADIVFLNTLRDEIHRNIGNADLTIEEIAEALNMSRASFYRKIKGLLDMKPNEYIRLERLKMAAHLIKENKYPIGEICYIVGFNSPSYFAKCFCEQFGVLPKDYN